MDPNAGYIIGHGDRELGWAILKTSVGVVPKQTWISILWHHAPMGSSHSQPAEVRRRSTEMEIKGRSPVTRGRRQGAQKIQKRRAQIMFQI